MVPLNAHIGIFSQRRSLLKISFKHCAKLQIVLTVNNNYIYLQNKGSIRN